VHAFFVAVVGEQRIFLNVFPTLEISSCSIIGGHIQVCQPEKHSCDHSFKSESPVYFALVPSSCRQLQAEDSPYFINSNRRADST